VGRLSKQDRFQRLKKLSNGPHPAVTILYGRRYLRDYPEDAVAWIWVAIALVEMARYEEAEQALAKSIEFFSQKRMHLPLAQMGHLFMKAGDYEQAAVWYTKAIEAAPDNAGRHIHLGGIRAQQGRFSEAEESLRKAIECPKGCIEEAYLYLGFVLRARERFEEAAECFREAIRRDPQYRAAHSALRDVERCLKLKGRP
jgi:tetratricopeptide (TPR) repeat protein